MAGKKRGRPATGRSEAKKIRSFELAAEYNQHRANGMSHDEALETMSRVERWTLDGRYFLGVEAIKADIKASRSTGLPRMISSTLSAYRRLIRYGERFLRLTLIPAR